jgi:hypothetical protein
MKGRVIASVLAAALGVGCSSESTGPTTPSASGGTADLRGTWVQVSGDTRTWVLEQGAIQAGGTASFSQSNNPSVGAVSGTGGVLGAVVLGSFRFAETYESLNIPSRPYPNNCYIDTDGQLVVSGSTLRGSVTETLGCAGERVSQVTRDLVMQRR